MINPADPILTALNEPQQQAVITTEGPLLILAGAGSGKTRVLTHRIAYLCCVCGIAPHSVLAVTFTNKAAREMQERTKNLLSGRMTMYSYPTVCTFHAFGVKVLRKDIALLGYDPDFIIADTDDQKKMLKEIFSDLGIEYKAQTGNGVLGHISRAKSNFITPSEFSQAVETQFDELVNSVYPLYQKKLRQHQAVDFDDLITLPVQLFQEKPEVLDFYHNTLEYLMIDEYQDTNQSQYVLSKLLAEKHHNICVVGDDDQSIYSWRGADIRNILDFEKDYPEAVTITLGQNYRSTKNILQAASSVIAVNNERKAKKLWTDNEEGELVGYYEAFNEGDEARFIAEEILQHTFKNTGTTQYQDIAILYRTNAQSRVLEESMIRRAIPYQVVGGTKFYERKEIRDIIAYFRCVANQFDRLSFDRIINFPPRGIGMKALEVIAQVSQRNPGADYFTILVEVLQSQMLSKQAHKGIEAFLSTMKLLKEQSRSLPIRELFDLLCSKISFIEYYQDGSEEGAERIENIYEFTNILEEYSEISPDQALHLFLEEVALLSDADTMHQDKNQVTLITMHAVKGLEFPIVFVSGMEEGLFPHQRSSMDEKSLEEERRLCYVACTRAKKKLYLTRARERSVYGSSSMTLASRFLDDIPEHLLRPLHIRAWEQPPVVVLKKNLREQEGFVVTQNIFKDGDKVDHKTFGEGVVVQTKGDEVVIAFKTVGIKHLMAGLAPIKKIM